MIKNNSILIMNDSYYPNPSPNGICTEKIAKEMKKNNYNVEIITKKNIFNQGSYEKIMGINVSRLNLGIFSNLLLLSESKNINVLRKILLFIFKIKGALLGLIWPVLSPAMIVKYYLKADDLIKNKDIDTVICVYKQIEAVLAGLILKLKYPKLKLVIYTLDSISGSHIPTILKNKNIAKNSIERWEKLIFKYSDYILMMNSHRSYYSSKKFDKFRNKIYYLDIPLLDTSNYSYNRIDKKNKISNIIFTGSMSEYTANPRYFIKLLENINDKKFVFNIYGRIDKKIKEDIEKSKLYNKQIILHGEVSHDVALKKQREADVLINFGNGNRCMIPSKIFEYISTGKPIISLTYSDKDSSLEYIEKYENHLIIKELDEYLIKNSKELEKFLEADFKELDKSKLERKYEKSTPKYFVNFLENCIRR